MNQRKAPINLCGTITINYGSHAVKHKGRNLSVDKKSIRISKIEKENNLQDIEMKFTILGKRNSTEDGVKILVKTVFHDKVLSDGSRIFCSENIINGRFNPINIVEDWKIFSCFDGGDSETSPKECEKSFRLTQAMSLLTMSVDYVGRALNKEALLEKDKMINKEINQTNYNERKIAFM